MTPIYLLVMVVLLAAAVRSQSTDYSVSLWAFSDSACMTSFNQSLLDVVSLTGGTCPAPAQGSSAQLAGFTEVVGLCSVSTAANNAIITINYYNTSAPPISNSSYDSDCPSDYSETGLSSTYAASTIPMQAVCQQFSLPLSVLLGGSSPLPTSSLPSTAK